MEMKNKLYCHHKSKFSLVLRKFMVASLSVSLFALAITIPTYLSVRNPSNVPTLASEKNEPEAEEEVVEEDSEDINVEKLA